MIFRLWEDGWVLRRLEWCFLGVHFRFEIGCSKEKKMIKEAEILQMVDISIRHIHVWVSFLLEGP